jgi:hypothetical protein
MCQGELKASVHTFSRVESSPLRIKAYSMKLLSPAAAAMRKAASLKSHGAALKIEPAAPVGRTVDEVAMCVVGEGEGQKLRRDERELKFVAAQELVHGALC